MKRISIITDSFYGKDRLFDASDKVSNRDGCLEHMILFKVRAEALGYEVHTNDLLPPEKADVCFYSDMPSAKPFLGTQNFLFLYESRVVRPDNWVLSRHDEFNKVFTWDDELVDQKRYFKMNFLVPEVDHNKDYSPRAGFLTQISGNKVVYDAQELYSQRIESIRWWESHYPDEFTFYGMGWDLPTWGRNLWWLNKITWLRKYAPQFKRFGGRLESKAGTLSKYKFSLCYENAFGFPGYITEKLFDCLFAGTIPVYWGPPNITDHVPEGCFIDRTRFSSHAQLREFLVSMTEEEYLKYRGNISDFLAGSRVRQFLAPFFADTVIPLLG